MSSRISLWAGLIGVSATVVLVQPNIAAAKSSVEIAETAKAITVLITGSDSVGSGVILERKGDTYTVLTAAHVVKSKPSFKITTPDDRSYQVIISSIRRAPGSIDLAVVKFKSTAKYPTAKLGNCNILKSGMALYLAGFPAASEKLFVFRAGKVSANSNKVFGNGYSLVYTNNTSAGMSGGAVLDSDGKLVAIHGRGDRFPLIIGNLRDFGKKTGFNRGIPINRFATVASNMGIDLGGQVAQIPTDTSPTVDDYIASAAQNFENNDYQGALADYNRVIEINPKSVNAYIARGQLRSEVRQDDRGALADYNQAIENDPNSAEAYHFRGSLKNDKFKDYRGALADYNRAIDIDPEYANPYVWRGLVKYDLQDRTGAIADVRQAAKLYQQKGNTKGYEIATAWLKYWQASSQSSSL